MLCIVGWEDILIYIVDCNGHLLRLHCRKSIVFAYPSKVDINAYFVLQLLIFFSQYVTMIYLIVPIDINTNELNTWIGAHGNVLAGRHKIMIAITTSSKENMSNKFSVTIATYIVGFRLYSLLPIICCLLHYYFTLLGNLFCGVYLYAKQEVYTRAKIYLFYLCLV